MITSLNNELALTVGQALLVSVSDFLFGFVKLKKHIQIVRRQCCLLTVFKIGFEKAELQNKFLRFK